MKLKCHCGCTLTKSLFKAKKYSTYDNVEVYTDFEGSNLEEVVESVRFIPRGSFILEKAVKGYHGTARVSYPQSAAFLVDPSMVLDQTQLEFREGYGCCGLAFGGFHCPSCKKILGRIFLDCYQLNRVEFFQGQVELTCKE